MTIDKRKSILYVGYVLFIALIIFDLFFELGTTYNLVFAIIACLCIVYGSGRKIRWKQNRFEIVYYVTISLVAISYIACYHHKTIKAISSGL